MLCGDHAVVGKRIYEVKQGTDYFQVRIGTLPPARRERRSRRDSRSLRTLQRSTSHHGGDFFICCVFILITLLYRWRTFQCKYVLNSGIKRVSTCWAPASVPSGVLCWSSGWWYCDMCSPDCPWQRMLRFLLGRGWEFTSTTMGFGIPPKALLPLPEPSVSYLLFVCF